ncbi:MAG: multiheme c-type cytochrome [Myxococcota bacterium]
MRRCVASVFIAFTLGFTACGGEATVASDDFAHPSDCAACHPTQHREWQGSVMHYAAVSPVFNAFEIAMVELSEGQVAANGPRANFCNECHSPTGVYNDEIPGFDPEAGARPMVEQLSEVGRQGVSCDVCHTVTGPDIEESLLQDGIANVSFLFEPGAVRVGPFADAQSSYHETSSSTYLSSAEFCGSCHDVRLPKADVITGEPFQRLENLFTEWQEGPYATSDNPYGKPIRCQDCHMSLYPLEAPGTFPQMPIADDPQQPNLKARSHALHAFTAVSFPFIDDPEFPNVDSAEVDAFGYPLGQRQRREQMLRAAVTLTLEGTATTADANWKTLPIDVTVTNTGAGHRVPAGFSQERQVWIELVVRDDAGIVYQSGHLADIAHPETGEGEPDGRLDDEDLQDHHVHIDPQTLASTYEPGPDVDQRPARNLGLVNFQNKFVRIREDGSWETVINPLLADHMDNGHSLDMLVPTSFRYDVPRPDRAIVGDVQVTARLRYRAFPPHFLRALAQRQPDLVTEAIVDRNTIVDMAESDCVITFR